MQQKLPGLPYGPGQRESDQIPDQSDEEDADGGLAQIDTGSSEGGNDTLLDTTLIQEDEETEGEIQITCYVDDNGINGNLNDAHLC